MSYTPLADPVFTGNPRVPTQSPGDNDTSAASTGFVTSAIATAGSNYVTLTGTQTISGAKTFTGTTTLSGNSVAFNNSSILWTGSTTLSTEAASAATDIIQIGVNGDNNNRLSIYASGKLEWSDGDDPADTVLERTGANILSLGSDDYLRAQASPVDAYDLTNKAYVDGVASGLQLKQSARAATTGNITLEDEQTIDGVAVVAGDRVLVKNQTAGEDNGIYDVVDGGAWTRSYDLDEPAELTAGIFVFVEEGTVNADSGWVLVTDNPIVLGTDPQTWTQFSGAGSIVAGDGLTKSGNTLNVGEGTGLVVNADDVEIDEAYVMTLGTTQTVTGAKTFEEYIFVDGDFGGIDLLNSAQLRQEAIAAVDVFLDARVESDDNSRLAVYADGKMEWGSGSAVADTNLYRSAEDTLKTDDAFHVAGLLQALSNVDVDGTLTVDGATTVSGKTTLDAGVNYKTATKTANYSVNLASDHIILVDTATAAGATTITLPASHAEGDIVVIKDSGGAAETKNVTVATADSDTIDGAANFVINVNFMAATFVSDGTNWFVV